MRTRQELPPGVLELSAQQAGVITRAQLLDLSVSLKVLQRQLRESWRTLMPGIYLTHRGEVSWDAALWAGLLKGGPGAVIGGEAAGFEHRLITAEPWEISVFVPQPKRRQSRGRWKFIRSERTGTGRPIRTTLEDTLLDMCRSRSEADTIALLADALATRRTTPQRILGALETRARYPREKVFRDVLHDVGLGVHSILERDYLKDVEQAHGLPTGRRQVRLAGITDVVYEQYSTVVELDGTLGHIGSAAFRDMGRDNRNTVRSLSTLRFGHRDVRTRPCLAAEQMAQVLTTHGWDGTLLPCPRCRQQTAA